MLSECLICMVSCCPQQEIGKPVYAEFRFEMAASFDYDTFFGDAQKVEDFKAGVKAQLAAKLPGVAASAIVITRVYKGSIVVDLYIETVGLTQTQLQNVVGMIVNEANTLFTPEFKATWGIESVTGKVVAAPSAGPNIPAIVGGVVGGVGGAAVIGGATWFILKKR